MFVFFTDIQAVGRGGTTVQWFIWNETMIYCKHCNFCGCIIIYDAV